MCFASHFSLTPLHAAPIPVVCTKTAAGRVSAEPAHFPFVFFIIKGSRVEQHTLGFHGRFFLIR